MILDIDTIVSHMILLMRKEYANNAKRIQNN